MKTILEIVITSLLMVGVASAQNFGPWSKPVNMGPAINSASDDMHPALSKDGLSLYFSSTRPGSAGGSIDLWVSQRESLDSLWQPPQNLYMLNTIYDDHAANLTMDGHWLFFYSTRPGGCNDGNRQELWASHRQNPRNDFGWEPPINLGCTLNAYEADDGGPGHWQDEETGIHYLYFARNYLPKDSKVYNNGFSIYVSTCMTDLDSCNQQQLWSPPNPVVELNSTGFRNTKTAIRQRDGLEIIITSNRTVTTGLTDLNLWVASRASTSDNWEQPINLDLQNQDKCLQLDIVPPNCAEVNSTKNDGAAVLSWDGLTMLFYSLRDGGLGGNDLYISTRRKLPDDLENCDGKRRLCAP
jgi:hypothetical protein